eukprot:12440744-Ditylum_brightwellii.AAC.1
MRNAELHRTPLCKDASPTLDANIKYAYNTVQHQMSGYDAQLFLILMADQLKMTNKTKFHWLRAVNIVVKAFTKVKQ